MKALKSDTEKLTTENKELRTLTRKEDVNKRLFPLLVRINDTGQDV
jgi:hypothetical protein